MNMEQIVVNVAGMPIPSRGPTAAYQVCVMFQLYCYLLAGKVSGIIGQRYKAVCVNERETERD